MAPGCLCVVIFRCKLNSGPVSGEMSGNRIERLQRYFLDRPDLGLASVYLFGSWTTSRPHWESDLGLGLLADEERFPEARDRLELRALLSGELAAEAGDNLVELLILNDAPPPLARRILIEGRRLACEDPRSDRAFFRDVQIRAADLEPFLRRVRRARVETLSR